MRPPITAPASPEVKEWDGFGTALKPASEHWILVRKPIEGTIAANVLEHGVGGLNIDGCRVETSDKLDDLFRHRLQGRNSSTPTPIASNCGYESTPQELGRFPANLVLSHSHDCDDAGCADGCPIKLMDSQSGNLVSGGHWIGGASNGYGSYAERAPVFQPSDKGGASRYFPQFHYYPKASTKDRTCGGKAENNHPTVKNRELMKWLCRLVTPPGGTVLDCFAGSGSTAIACLEEGFNYILIEQDAESVKTANDRVNAWMAEHRPKPTIEDRLTWLETKVEAIDKRSRKTAETMGQLNLFDRAS